MPQVKFPPLMKYYVENQNEFSAPGASVSDLFENILLRYPALKPHLFDAKNHLRRHFQIFVNGVHIRELDGMNTKLNKDDKVVLVASAAGG